MSVLRQGAGDGYMPVPGTAKFQDIHTCPQAFADSPPPDSGDYRCETGVLVALEYD